MNVEDVGGLASDLGEMNSLSLVVEIDDNGDGVSDLTLSTEVDIFGYDF